MEIRETFANKCNSILSNNVHPPVSFPSRGRNLFLKLEYEMPLVLSELEVNLGVWGKRYIGGGGNTRRCQT